MRLIAPLCVVVLIAIQGCSNVNVQVVTDRLPLPERSEPRPSQPPVVSDQIPWEPRSRAGNYTPYRVLGKTYHVMDDATGYSETGVASWYGGKFHGRPTSNGERFDKNLVSAAHKSLPIPTWVRVENLDSGQELLVRVNDRGPFHGKRIIDLSEEAARQLGFHQQGTAIVRITALTAASKPAQPASKPTAPAPATAAGTGVASRSAPAAAEPVEPELSGPVFIHVGAHPDAGAAESHRKEVTAILDSGTPVLVLREADTYLVRVGPFEDSGEAERLQFLLIAADQNAPLIVRDEHIEAN